MDNFLFLPRALAAGLYDVAFAAAFGLALADLWLQRSEHSMLRSSMRRATVLCACAMLGALGAQAYLLTGSMIASAAFAEVRPQLTTVLTETHAGRNLVLNGLCLTALLTYLAISRWRRPRIDWPLLSLLTLLAAVRSASGHAASNGDFALPEYIQCLHLVSIAIWAGAVIAGGLLVLPALLRQLDTATVHTFTRKLSSTVTVALLFVILTGIYNAWHGLGGAVSPLLHTQWGYLLDAKSLLVLAALILGGLNRRLLRPQLAFTQPQATRLAKLLRAEAILMLLILIVSAFLANSPPADTMTM
jgi:putative copper resistance protein D